MGAPPWCAEATRPAYKRRAWLGHWWCPQRVKTAAAGEVAPLPAFDAAGCCVHAGACRCRSKSVLLCGREVMGEVMRSRGACWRGGSPEDLRAVRCT